MSYTIGMPSDKASFEIQADYSIWPLEKQVSTGYSGFVGIRILRHLLHNSDEKNDDSVGNIDDDNDNNNVKTTHIEKNQYFSSLFFLFSILKN